ncbi:MAG: thioredoxin domain-containing protein [Armatimonadetes bacterium]|nr:thioredoxin domain-containing protein [Armatimonadota bacterium]
MICYRASPRPYIGGSGGWPLNVWLTPDLKPFFAGTYFPPDPLPGLTGLKPLLQQIEGIWRTEREKLLASSKEVEKQLKAFQREDGSGTLPDRMTLKDAFLGLKQSFDSQEGGFGAGPKFPEALQLIFLSRYHASTGDPTALAMVERTLRALASGGIRDHLGGCFHRYATDAHWAVPHFEKMLYDQALLTWAFLEAYQATGNPLYARVAKEILTYVRRDLGHPEGGFYAGEDAESSPDPGHPEAHEEGAYYVWTIPEIDAVLPKDLDAKARLYFGMRPEGNTQSGELRNKNVLRVAFPVETAAKRLNVPPGKLRKDIEAVRVRLLEARARRPRPHRDEKILASWNGLTISAFARSYQILGDSGNLRQARRAADFILERLVDPKSGRLKRYYRNGASEVEGFAGDYSAMIYGLLDLYEASAKIAYIEAALRLQEKQLELFWDPKGTAFFETQANVRPLHGDRERYDGAEPSSNSLAAMNLLRLSEMLDRRDFRLKAEGILKNYSTSIAKFSTALPQMLCAVDRLLARKYQIVLAGSPDGQDIREFLNSIHRFYLPNKTLLYADGGPGQAFLARSLKFLEEVVPMDGRASAFICQNYACKLPTNDRRDCQGAAELDHRHEPGVITNKLSHFRELAGENPCPT